MKVCFPYFGQTIGGSHISSLLLFDELKKRGFDPFIVVDGEGVLTDYIKSKGYQTKSLSIGPLASSIPSWTVRGWQLAVNSKKIKSALKRWDVDLVYTNDSRTHLEWVIASKLMKLPHVFHVRNNWVSHKYTNLLSRLTDRFVNISEYTQRQCPNFVQEKSQTIMNPFIVPDLKKKNKRRAEILDFCRAKNSARIIGFVSNLYSRKRPDVFINAAAKISENTDAEFVFVMFGDDRDCNWPRLEKQAEDLGIAGSVRYLGFKSDISNWISAFDLFLATSVREPLGRTLIEAMFVGVPVIAARSGGYVETIKDGETGFFFEPDNSQDLAEKAIELLSDPVMESHIIHQAREWAQKKCSLEHHTEQMIEIFRSLLKTNR